MSDTPKTDELQGYLLHSDTYTCWQQTLKLAERLERENAALRSERDSYRFRAEQIWGLRKEIQQALNVPTDCEGDEALKRGLKAIGALRADKERLDWISRNRSVSLTEKPLGVSPESLRAAIDAARKEEQ